LSSAPCKCNDTIYFEIVDNRNANVGRKLLTCSYKAEVINDNVLRDTKSFLAERFTQYLSPLGFKCFYKDSTIDSNKLFLKLTVNIITPEVRGVIWVRARGLVEIEAELSKNNSIIFHKTYQEVAKDSDKDVPLPWYSAVTFEMAGKIVTAASIKRIADSISIDLCKITVQVKQ
jgi:hypothetical protein